ncbi:mucin-like protein isoform X2 [Astyanax mexicanus]|uniref:mucin-like protein isoform X2 n=1 Tax=Astyanax mexicanus TaxID=7994 RepID=UPI0020CB00F0|nr:mucin-like protein isoform X2 [Astyanax mexicanus]
MPGSGFNCTDVDECAENSTLPNDCSRLALCNNTEGSYTCRCLKGYQGDGFTCVDVDECQLPLRCGRNMVCHNTPGAYTCDCVLGTVYDYGTCVNASTCANATSVCSTHAECSVILGSYYCACRTGFYGNGTQCMDIDECALVEGQPCPQHANCFNTEGSYFCNCWDGYQDNETNCMDINECDTGNFTCPNNSTCKNKDGGYLCLCNAGFVANNSLCLDIDECAAGLALCPNSSDCQNTIGSFFCECWDGYAGNASHCEDINECLDNATCPQHSTCVNTPGTFLCPCDVGFYNNDTHSTYCRDIDECSKPDLGPLCTNGTCINTAGSFYCDCNAGFRSNVTMCFDIDECSESHNKSVCQPYSTCTNIPGSFECKCYLGFQLNGRVCEDIDECQAKQSPCTENSKCVNTVGSFLCPCVSGFKTLGAICVDINECLFTNSCRPDQVCRNLPGSYQCSCPVGYHEENGTCTDTNECQNATTLCHALARCWNTVGSFSCTCPLGYSGDGTVCKDINECSATISPCHRQARCFNTPGSYICVCSPGFLALGRMCVDRDECQQNRGGCHPAATCYNLVPGFQCQCASGWEPTSQNGIGAYGCIDQNECLSTGACSGKTTCTNSIGSFSCTCPDDNTNCQRLSLNDSRLFPFGDEVGDTGLPMSTADGNSPYITPPKGFPVMGKIYDRIFFSDNGLVQFQEVTENEKLLFPAPFPDGFIGNENLALLAVFWDDADLTLGNGKLFYQEYDQPNLSDMYSQLVFNHTADEVSKFEAKRGRPAFTPTWILKITWDHVLPVSYQKINLSETNTFQSILATDGSRSYALLQYGEMNWGPGQRTQNNALIGYTDGVGNFHNEIPNPPDNLFGPGGRYRPQTTVFNTGQLGQIVYDLNGASVLSSDSQRQCQVWALKEPDPKEWALGLTPCPCTRSQALEDLNFGPETLPVDNGMHIKELRGLRWGGSGGQAFQSLLYNKQNAGKRCVYDAQGPLLAGYSERYFTKMQDHIDKDLLPFQWCCVQSPLCQLYLEKRPLDRCQGFGWTSPDPSIPGNRGAPGIGLAYGSLHFTTFDGKDYTFKALGVFVIVRLSSITGSNVFTLQGETAVLQSNGQATRVPALVRVAAYHQTYGKVEWRSPVSEEKLTMLIKDVDTPVSSGAVYSVQQGFAVRCSSVLSCVAVYEGGLNVAVWRGEAGRLTVLVEVPQSFYNRTLGLLGLWSSNVTDDFLQSNGRLLSFPDTSSPSEDKLAVFGQSWAVPVPESLLFSVPPLTPFQPVSTEELMSSVSPATLARHLQTCQGSMQCVHDILATDNTALGLQTMQDQKKLQSLTVTFGSMPPMIEGPTVVLCKVNSTLRVQFLSQDSNKDAFSFSLLPPRPPQATIGSADGILVWTPLSIQPVLLTVQVSDQTSSSLLSPIIKLCNCLNGGSCQYQTVADNYLQGKFQVVGCLCPAGFSGKYCGNRTDVCKGKPCFPGVDCFSQREPDSFTCGVCPPPTVSENKQGYKCFENDFCLPPFPAPCHPMANCYSTGYNYTCSCKPGFTGDGKKCTDIDECQNPAACSNAKYECVNTPGSSYCSCRYHSTEDSDGCGVSANPPGWNVFNVSMVWNDQMTAPQHLTQLEQILSQGFQNKFYNASIMPADLVTENGLSEYRINVSSDTPHWYVLDYLKRAGRYYSITAAYVDDLNECKGNETLCTSPAVCYNTYGGYRCVCNGTDLKEAQSCILDRGILNHTSTTAAKSLEDKKPLILGLVLGIGIPLLLMLLLAAFACFCCSRRKTITGDIPHLVPAYVQNQISSHLNYDDPALHYKSHCSPRILDNITPQYRRCRR